MSRSVVSLCNGALARLGQSRFIASLDEASTEARLCGALFENCRDALLEEFPWRWATQMAPLALRKEVSDSHWRFVYAWPARALSVRAVLMPRPSEGDGPAAWRAYAEQERTPCRFEVRRGMRGVSVLTDVEGAVARCTMRITDPADFPALWAEALQWRLAMELCVALTGGKSSLREQLAQFYAASRSAAIEADGGMGTEFVSVYVPDYVGVR